MSKKKDLKLSGKEGLQLFLGVARNDKNLMNSALQNHIPGISEKLGISSLKPKPRKKFMPGPDYQPGKDSEFDYFNPPKMARAMKKGGVVKKDRRDGLAQRGLTKGTMR